MSDTKGNAERAKRTERDMDDANDVEGDGSQLEPSDDGEAALLTDVPPRGRADVAGVVAAEEDEDSAEVGGMDDSNYNDSDEDDGERSGTKSAAPVAKATKKRTSQRRTLPTRTMRAPQNRWTATDIANLEAAVVEHGALACLLPKRFSLQR